MVFPSEARSVPIFSKVKMKKNYFREIQQELKKVTWTTREELVTLTKIVLGGTFFGAFAIYFIDLFVKGSLEVISFIARILFG